MQQPTRSFIRLCLPPNPVWVLKNLCWFWRDYRQYSRLSGQRLLYQDLLPALADRLSVTPIGYYFYQDTWAFQKIVRHRPARHVDVGSTALLVGCLASVVPTVSVDIRPLRATLPGLSFLIGSITSLPFDDNSVASLSSLCVIEHVGLGRYGDPVDPEGSIKAGRELARVLRPQGNLYISVPIGTNSKTVFNAHRIFTQEDAVKLFPGLCLVDHSLIGNEGPLASISSAAAGDFPVGLFHFTK